VSITVAGERLVIRFDRFDLESYDLFLKAKRLPEFQVEFEEQTEAYTITAPARFAPMLGVPLPEASAQALPLAEFLFDDQDAITRMALDAKRFACWSACGTGKTLIGLEFARHVCHRIGGRVLIVTVNEVVQQWLDEAAKFYGDRLPVHRIRAREEMRHWCQHGGEDGAQIAVVNYEKWNPERLETQVVSEARYLAGVVLDEASRLKASGGKQKWALIKSCRGIEYKLTLTATPAPNELMEYASQASFLEKMRSEGEIIWTFFRRDEKTHRWTVKPHAREAFFRFMAGWSIYVNNPKQYGWRLSIPEAPEPTVFVHEIEPTPEQLELRQRFSGERNGQLLLWGTDATNAIQRAKLSQTAKGFRYLKGEAAKKYERIPSRKPEFVANLIREEVASGHQVLVWTVFNAESKILAELLAEGGMQTFDLLTGDTKEAERLAVLERFRGGASRCLISRAAMLGFGMNFQCCTSMIFSGFDDSWERMYQAIRRAYRHGQTQSVRVHIPVIHDLEGDMWENICAKESRHTAAIEEMERNYIKATNEIKGRDVA